MILEDISVTILTKDSQKHIKELLESVKLFGEVLLYDTGSNDNTLNIAQQFKNVRILRAPFVGFGPTHNMASASAKNNWILSIDSDEILTDKAIKAIIEEKIDCNAVYSFQRHNYFNGKLIKYCGWYPDRQIRLYNKTQTKFSDDQVHEAIISTHMRHMCLKAPIIHYSYHSISDFLNKMQSYSNLFATQYQGRKKSSFSKALSHGAFAFFKSYILKRGFLGGYEGYVISTYNSHTAYYKYLKLYEANLELKKHQKQER